MFGNELLNGKDLAEKLNISLGTLYKLVRLGMPYHQLGAHTRKYYVLDEVCAWFKESS